MKKLVIALIFLTASSSFGAPPRRKTPTKTVSTSKLAPTRRAGEFFSDQQVDVLHFLPGPPRLNSTAARADFAKLEKLQKSRTKLDCTRAMAEAKGDIASFFAKPYGSLSASEVAKWRPFLARVMTEGKPYLNEAKKHWARSRPYVADKRLHPCVPKENTFAYPSGHAMEGELMAKIFAKAYPAREKQIMLRGYQIGQDRLVGGAHYPSDVTDGRMLGFRMYQILLDHGKI